jgi:hypothetical protein
MLSTTDTGRVYRLKRNLYLGESINPTSPKNVLLVADIFCNSVYAPFKDTFLLEIADKG